MRLRELVDPPAPAGMDCNYYCTQYNEVDN